MNYLLSALIGYFIGCLNPAYIIGKIKGFDIRGKGTNNAGAANTLLHVGIKAGIFVALFDIFKAVVAVLLVKSLFHGNEYLYILSGVCCVIGHIFPFILRFKGGKGLAPFGGMILATDWRIFLMLLALAFILILITDYGVMATLATALLFPVLYYIFRDSLICSAMSAIDSVLILCKHRVNISRIINKTEPTFRAAWKRKQAS